MSQASDQPGKTFSVADANRMLPLVRAIVSDLVELAHDVTDRRHRLNYLMSGRDHEPTDLYQAELADAERGLLRDTQRLREYVEELRQLGVEAKGDDGLVDFPAVIGGRRAYLCWKLGEPEVMFWHDLEGGFSARKPLPSRSPQADGDEGVESISGNSLG